MVRQKDVQVERGWDGSLRLYAMDREGAFLVRCVYIGYTKREALRLFTQEVNTK